MYDLIGYIFQRENRQKPSLPRWSAFCARAHENIYQLMKAYGVFYLDCRRSIPWINNINKRFRIFYPWKFMVKLMRVLIIRLTEETR